MNCSRCNQEFTKSDEAKVNYTEYMGKYYHKMCPGETCRICNEVIESYVEAKKGAGGQGWTHKTCKPCKISRPDETVTKPEPSSWIVKK